jgi:hypothetical protein
VQQRSSSRGSRDDDVAAGGVTRPALLEMWEGCQNVLAQWRRIIALASPPTEADVDNTDKLTRDRLTSTFREIRRR